MYPSFLRSERLILADPMDPRLPRNVSSWDRFVATLTSPELLALIIFCVLGLLVMAALNLLVPNVGEITAPLQPFL